MKKNNLLSIRKQMGYEKISSFAEYLGVSEGTYWRWEHNVKQPSIKTAVRIASKLSVTLDEVFN